MGLSTFKQQYPYKRLDDGTTKETRKFQMFTNKRSLYLKITVAVVVTMLLAFILPIHQFRRRIFYIGMYDHN